MPWRLTSFLLFLAVFVLFAAFNLGNVADISFGFYTLQKVPIFISIFLSFILGALVVLPFSLAKSRRTRLKKELRTPKNKKTSESDAAAIRAERVAGGKNAGSADYSDRYEGNADTVIQSSFGQTGESAALDADTPSATQSKSSAERKRSRLEKKNKS
ncbi:MAG TPA: hypothetical protein VMW87_01735 [Spirochaetia bacterium]|nr:hypothetical protein [Spirochaetia bacterium]